MRIIVVITILLLGATLASTIERPAVESVEISSNATLGAEPVVYIKVFAQNGNKTWSSEGYANQSTIAAIEETTKMWSEFIVRG